MTSLTTEKKYRDHCAGLPTHLWRQLAVVDTENIYARPLHSTVKNRRGKTELFTFSDDEELIFFTAFVGFVQTVRLAPPRSSITLWCVLDGKLKIISENFFCGQLCSRDVALIQQADSGLRLEINFSKNAKLFICQLPQLKFQEALSDLEILEKFALLESCSARKIIRCVREIASTIHTPSLRRHFVYGKLCQVCSLVLDNMLQKNIENIVSLIQRDSLLIARKAEPILRQQYAAPPTLDSLARSIGTNRNKLAKSFKNVHGLSVFEYCQHYRMAIARKMLRKRRYSVAQVAERVGYEHAGNFSVAYKRHFGELPKNTRRHALFIKKENA